MTEHVLDGNTAESSYFARQNKNGKAAYRHALLSATGSLPLWAMSVRKVVTSKVVTATKVVTLPEVVTEDWRETGGVDPLTLI